jgi:hypothetical protein
MGITSVDLFRSGNATSARLDKVRTQGPGRDVDTRMGMGGNLWVIANGKGISCSSAVDPTWRGQPWKLLMGHTYSNLLIVWSDEPGHWVWQPVQDMLLFEYVDALSSTLSKSARIHRPDWM